MTLDIPNLVEKAWVATAKITSSERGTFIFFVLLSLGAVIFSIIYFTDNINGIVKDHNVAIKEQRQEFLQALKDLK